MEATTGDAGEVREAGRSNGSRQWRGGETPGHGGLLRFPIQNETERELRDRTLQGERKTTGKERKQLLFAGDGCPCEAEKIEAGLGCGHLGTRCEGQLHCGGPVGMNWIGRDPEVEGGRCGLRGWLVEWMDDRGRLGRR